MAKYVTIKTVVEGLDGTGQALPNRVVETQYLINEIVYLTLTIPNNGSKTFCVEGTNVSGITDPIVVGLTAITGYRVESTQQLSVKEDGAALAVTRGPGVQLVENANLNTLQLSNTSGSAASVKVEIWG